MPSAPFDTPRRRHSFGSSLKSFRETNIPLNDDASEIRSRRKSIADSIRRKSLTLLGGSGSPARTGAFGGQIISTPSQRNATRPLEVVTPIPSIPVEQMYINFEEWMKMATDNKINANNSWKLALIDYFHEMTLLKEGDSINFQRASCTLDGCVKIYTSRVDSVATETGKLLSGLADSSKNNNENDGDDGDDEEADSERRTRKKNTRSESTLAKDYASLTIKKFDLEFSVDPLFKKTSADFDEGGAQGLLLNHLSVDTDGKIIFDASDAIPDEDDDENDNDRITEEDNESKIDISKLRSKYLSGLQQIFNKEICPSLKDFEFSGDNILDFAYNTPPDTGSEDYPDFFDIDNNNNDNYNDNDVLGDNLDINGDVSGVFDDDINLHARLTEKDYVMAMVSNENELFSYFDSAFLRNWAGPEHWKLKRANKKPTETEGETRERKKKEPISINFIESEDLDEQIIFSSGGNTINAPKLAEKVSHGHLLPDDMHFSSKQLLQLFLKPQFMLKSKRRYEAQLDNSDDVDVDENFWADQTNDPAETSFPDMTIYTGGDAFYNDDDDGYDDELEGEFGDNLVTQAKRNKPEFIKYAKTAKRIDVKKLKENIWKTLIDNPNERRSSNNRLSTSSRYSIETRSQEQKFTGVINDLKKIYPQKKMKDISVPFCFICLLHLANEKNLNISSNGQLAELCIVKEM